MRRGSSGVYPGRGTHGCRPVRVVVGMAHVVAVRGRRPRPGRSVYWRHGERRRGSDARDGRGVPLLAAARPALHSLLHAVQQRAELRRVERGEVAAESADVVAAESTSATTATAERLVHGTEKLLVLFHALDGLGFLVTLLLLLA